MAQKILFPLALFSGVVGGGTITFFSQEEKNYKNTNNLIIYKKGEKGTLIVGNNVKEEVKKRRDDLKIVRMGEKEKSWERAEEREKKEKNTFWLMGEEKVDNNWLSVFLPTWISWLWGDSRGRVQPNWEDITDLKQKIQEVSPPSRQLEENKKESSTFYLKGVHCQNLLEEIKKKKNNSGEIKNLAGGEQSLILTINNQEKSISVKCVNAFLT